MPRNIGVYWIIPRKCLGTPTNFNDSVVLIDDLNNDHDFPGL